MRIINQSNPTEYTVTMACCGIEVAYTKEDIEHRDFGTPHIKCPACGKYTWIDDHEEWVLEIIPSNIQFPAHFAHMGSSKDAKHLTDAEVLSYVKQVYHRLLASRHTDDGDFVVIGTGDTAVIGINYKDEYDIMVARDYYTFTISKDDC